MGTGKSLSFLAFVCAVKDKHPEYKAVITCPPHLVENWLYEIKKHTTFKGSPHFNKVDLSADIYVIPYTQVGKAEEVYKACKIFGADEGHYLKNLDAKRTMAFHTFFYKYTPEYFSYISGTPIKNRIPEIYSFLILMSKGPVEHKIITSYPSLYTFCCRFTNVRNTTYGMKFEGMKNVDELRKYINPYTIRNTSKGLPQLSQINVVVGFKESPELQAEWDRYLSEGGLINVKAKAEAAAVKASFTSNWVIEALAQERGPIVVFSDHVKPLEIIALNLSTYRVRTITGDTPMGKRQEYVNMLNNKQLDVLLCSIGAASSGYNMTGATLLVANDPPWVPADWDQMCKRIHRIGSTQDCQIVRVIGSHTDEYIYDVLDRKNKVINKVIKERQ